MTAIGYVIQPGQDIPEDVMAVEDRDHDAWRIARAGHWHTINLSIECEKNQGGDVDGISTLLRYAPLTVTAVREPQSDPLAKVGPEQGCEHGALIVRLPDITGVDKAVHLAAAVQNLVTAFKTAAPQQPSAPDFLAAVNKLTIARDGMQRHRDELHVELVKTRGEREDARAEVARLQSDNDRLKRVQERTDAEDLQVIAERDENADWADRLSAAIAEYLGVDIGEHSNANNPWACAYDAIAAMRAPDPSVLSLPQVPPGTVALIGAESGTRWVPIDGGSRWQVEGTYESQPIYVVLGREGSATAVMREPRTAQDNIDELRTWINLAAEQKHWEYDEAMHCLDRLEDALTETDEVEVREPRTWPRIDGVPEGIEVVRGTSGAIYRLNNDLWVADDDHATCDSFPSLQNYDGPLVEVFEDKHAGGEQQ